jgi:hypothetical protein
MREAMAYRPQFGTRHRDYVFGEARDAAKLAGRGDHPICPHCDLPVTPGQNWDEVHVNVPRCFGGKSKAVGHRSCNQRDNNANVTPAFAKAERVRKRHFGITGPGLGKHPMQCGRRSKLKKTIGHGVQRRLTHAEKHAKFLRDRYGFGAEGDGNA